MAKRSAKPIMLTEGQRTVLSKIERREKSTQQQIRRTKVILLSAQQLSNCDIARRLHITRGNRSSLAKSLAWRKPSHANRREQR
jgi:hypothetical protein